ncbi:MAG: ATP-binding protein [Proteobacteria bacterium]|nr:ATP-binding protein [Pseudomonadota bacterium]
MTLKPWREIAVPHKDVLQGTFQQAEFAADITRVHDGSATAEYQDPVLFFQRTFITEGMGKLLASVAERLAGKGGDPVIQLQTAFGGGKTHSMLAVLHMVGGVPANELPGVPAVLKAAGVTQLPNARIAVLDGNKLAPNQPRKIDGHDLRTLWGDLAWQLGGAQAYARVAESDAAGTSPGKDVLAEVIRAAAPCVILIDELVAYVRQFEDGKTLAGGSYDSILSFVQALTEAMKAVPNAVLLASLPESDREAGSTRGIAALHALEHYFGRVQAVWKPVSAGESFEIVRRRLFAEITDAKAVEAVCLAFANHYVTHAADLPGETQESQYFDRLRRSYPIHPEVFERLYRDWSALPNFQRTRGVLKLLARVIHRLWQDDNRDLMLMPGSFPLNDGAVRNELVTYLPAGWDPVLDRDVDGEHAEPVLIDQADSRFGAAQACRRVARTIFLGSAPSGINEVARGLETNRVVLGCLQPGLQPHLFRDALGRIENRLTYLHKGQDRWWLDVRPNLRREMEDRKRHVDDASVREEVAKALRRVQGTCSIDQFHIFAPAADIPDEYALRIVVLPLDKAWARSGPNSARDAAVEILRNRGNQPRQKQNRVLFLAADADQVMHLKDTARTLLAWRSIEDDARELRLTLDNQNMRQATQHREQTQEALLRGVRETFKCLVSPTQTLGKSNTPGDIEWEMHTLNPATPGLGREIDRVLAESELVIREWAPVHLVKLLRHWFWKDSVNEVAALDVWQKSCQYLYFPRLLNSHVMQATVSQGATSRDFFGLATSRDADKYLGFSFGRSAAIYMDALLLIEPKAAADYEKQTEPKPEPPSPNGPSPVSDPPKVPGPTPKNETLRPTRYFGTVELDPVRASLQFAKIVSELVELFSSKPSGSVRIKVDIEARDAQGFDETTIRAAKENGRTLGVQNSGFE